MRKAKGAILYSSPASLNDRDRGDTLVEVLVAVVFIGLAMTALIGGLLTSTSASITHRSQTTFSGVLQSFSEAARNAIQMAAYGAQFSTACGATFPYQIIGAPYPRSGPPGTAIAVLGTGFSTVGGVYSGATFNGSPITSAPLTGSASGTNGAITGLTVPSNLPAGTYSLDPFGSSPAASGFTITPALGPMTSAGGNKVSVAVSGFDAAPATISNVTVGGVTASIVSGSTLSPTGTSTVVFTIPAAATNTQQVVITDSSGVSSPSISLDIGSKTAPSTPIQTSSSLNDVQFNAAVAYLNTSMTPPWSTSCGGSGTNPNVQQLTLTLKDNQPGLGPGDVQSIVVSNLTPQQVPSPPTGLAGTVGDGQVPLSWTAPGYSGSSAVNDYYVLWSADAAMTGATKVDTHSASTSYTVPGLTNGTQYYFEVEAVNTSGTSSASNEVSVKPATTPGMPTNVTPTAASGQVTLSWTAPSDNGSAITDYKVLYSTSSNMSGATTVDTASTSTSYTVMGLTNGTQYYFEVEAVNSVGTGPASSPPVASTPTTTPGMPTNVTPTAASGQVTLSWTAPSDNGSAITDYKVLYSTSSNMSGATTVDTASTSTSYTVKGLINGTQYYFEVEAVNSNGTGQASTPPASATPASPPGAPTLSAPTMGGSGNNHTAQLSWIAPSSNGGSAITDYLVLYSTNSNMSGATTVDTGGTSLSFTVTGLTKNKLYYFEIEAVNAAGPGPASNQQSGHT